MWKYIKDPSLAYKMHITSGTIEAAVMDNLPEGLVTEDADKKVFFEPGGYGMYAMNQPRIVFSLPSGDLEIDVAKSEELFFELKNAENEGGFFRVYSRFNCLALSIEDRESLLSQLEDKLSDLRVEANVFFAETEKAWDKMKKEWAAENPDSPFPIVRQQDLKKETN